MQWFKHDNAFRRTASIQHIQSELGEAGYARAVKLMEVFCSACPRKPFVARIEIKPPFTWRWLALELGCPEEEVVRTIEVFEKATLIEIPEKVQVQPRSGKQAEILRPAVITCSGLMEKQNGTICRTATRSGWKKKMPRCPKMAYSWPPLARRETIRERARRKSPD